MAKGTRARARAERDERTPLQVVRDDLAAHELERRRLIELRDELVARGRAEGRSWGDLAGEAGTTRAALIRRAGAGPAAGGAGGTGGRAGG